MTATAIIMRDAAEHNLHYETLRTRCLEGAAHIEKLEAALRPFMSGAEWGATLAWITEGAPTRAQGISRCKTIVGWQRAADDVLTVGQSEKK